MNVAILGGRFDPPHIWHYWIAAQILECVKHIDQVWLMPDHSNAFKQIIASPSDRLDMLHYLEAGRIRVSTIALARENVTYTIELVSGLVRDQYNKYFWVVGSDVTSEFSRWRDYQKLSKIIDFLVFPRKDYPVKNLPSGFKKIEGNLLLSNVSSTLIRERVKNGLSIKGLVFPEVEEIIRTRNLYK